VDDRAEGLIIILIGAVESGGAHLLEAAEVPTSIRTAPLP